MPNLAAIRIKPALTFTPLSPFLAMLIDGACRRLEQPEALTSQSLTALQPQPVSAEPDRLDRTV